MIIKKDDPELTLYTISEVSEMLKVTQRTIYNYVHEGLLEGYKVANKWRFSKTNIQDFLDKLREKAPATYVKGTKKNCE